MRLGSLAAAAFLGISTLVAAPSAAAAAPLPHCKDYSVIKKDFSGETLHAGVPTTGHQNRDMNCVLSRGDRGGGVLVLQLTLNQCFTHITVDGIYGPETENAIRFLQGLNGIPADGIYGPQTAKEMSWAWYDADDKWRRCDWL